VTGKPEHFDQAVESLGFGGRYERLLDVERVPDLLEVATLEAARRQVRQVRQMSGRDRHVRPTNARAARRRESFC
jgi:hypothetical protein